MASLGEGVKQAVDWIEQERKPAWLICITPDEQPADLVGLAQSKGITNALMAHDPRNRLKISTKNIYQTHMMAALSASRSRASPTPRSPLRGG